MMSDEPCCGGGVRSDGVEGACVGDHGQPLSPVHRDPGGEPRRRDEMVTEHLYQAPQREAPGVGKGVRGPLQVRGGGGRIARGLRELGRLHPPQPGEGCYCEREAGREPAGLSVEQPG